MSATRGAWFASLLPFLAACSASFAGGSSADAGSGQDTASEDVVFILPAPDSSTGDGSRDAGLDATEDAGTLDATLPTADAAEASTWVPSQGPGQVFWLRPDLGYDPATGNWSDQIRSGAVATFSGSGLPTYSSSACPNNTSGLSIVSASSQEWVLPTFSLGSPVYTVVVGKWNTAYDNNQYLVDGTAPNSMALVRNGATSVAIDSAGPDFSWTSATPQTFGAYGLLFSGSSSSIALDGTVQQTGTVGAGMPGGVTVGAYGGGGLNADATICDVFGFTFPEGKTQPTGAQVANISAYVLARYGL